MELKPGGLIESHLAEITEATLVWLRYEKMVDQGNFDPLIASSMQLMEIPSQPEPLALLRQMRRYNLPMVAGGLLDQPEYFLREIEAVIVAEMQIAAELAQEAAQAAAEEEARKNRNANNQYRPVRG